MSSDVKLMFERILFSFGMILNLIFNIIILPIHILVWVCGKSIWPVIWPNAVKKRLEFVQDQYGEAVKDIIYKKE